jgi:ribulose kinase
LLRPFRYTQDHGPFDLARKYYLTLESLALQTRHIVDQLSIALQDEKEKVRAIYVSGGQAGNALLMRLFADVCEMPVVLPASHEGAVVLGAAMLGRFAAEITARSDRTEMTPKAQGEALWKIMVCSFFVRAFCLYKDMFMNRWR